MTGESKLVKAKNMYIENECMTMKDVSEMFGMHPDTLSRFLKKENVVIRRGFNPKIILYKEGKERYIKGETIGSICKDLDICRNRFSQYLKKQEVKVDRYPHKICFKNDVFNIIDTEYKAYWLGFLYADGCIRSGSRNGMELSLSKVDKLHIYKFRDFLESSHKITLKKSKLGDAYRISLEDEGLYKDLIRLGCIPKKSLILTFPTEDQVPKHLQRHFIRGYFDGDGGMSFTKKTTSINILGTNEFLTVLKNKVGVLKNKKLYPVRYDCNNKNTFRIQFEGKKDIQNFLDYIYKDSKIYLDRKYEKYINFVCRPIQ